jgi:FKBP-type peptidyl-prolyl cis-trans isomerase SlyD
MNIAKEKMVSVTYELKYDNADAQLIEKVEKDSPLTFQFGVGKMLEYFEKNIENMSVGDLFDFKLTAEQAYGPITDEAIVDVPMRAFMVDGKVDPELVKLGNTIPMMDSYGNRLHGIVLEINDETVKMDFNHPLAGEDLHFKGKVIEVRDPRPEELAHSCGCNSCGSEESDCGDGCGSNQGSCGCGCS